LETCQNEDDLRSAAREWLTNIWNDAPDDVRKEFLAMEKEDLIIYHMNLCQDMRNECHLWTAFNQGITETHPDDLSMSILENFHEEKKC